MDELWAEDAISATLSQLGLTPGADADLPDSVRFVRRVREIVSAASARHGGVSSPAVFVLAPAVTGNPPPEASFHGRIHTGEVDPSGRVWLVGTAVRSSYSLPLPTTVGDDVFEFVSHTLDLGTAPAVYCDTMSDPPVFAWYPHGLAEADDVYEGPMMQANAPTLDDLLRVVDRVHRTRLKTSFNQNADTTLWKDRSKHWAHDRAEKRVQDALMAGLGGAFGSPYFVEQETTGHSGRFDIGFRESVAAGTTKLHAVLELKVARSYGCTGVPMSSAENDTNVLQGVEQAWAYADEHGANDAACLVFDLRTDNDHQSPVAATSRATALSVLLRLWRCFPTAQDYRTFVVP